MLNKDEVILLIVLGGTVLMFLILVFFLIFVFMYQRRNARYRLSLVQIELERQQELITAIIQTEEKEREYFARELHDSVGQMLAAIKMNVSTVKKLVQGDEQLSPKLEMLQEITAQSIHEVRSISHKLLPGILSDFGLHDALEQLGKQIDTEGLKVNVKSEIKKRHLGKEKELALYRITQELLSNTIKYAHATEVDITLQEENNSIVFTYADNGKGLDADYFESMKTRAGLGIRNMESRVKMIKGTCVWENEPGKGLKFIITTAKEQS